jgi:hypothetical protein
MKTIFRFINKCSNYNNPPDIIGTRNHSWGNIIGFLMMPFDCLVISLLYPNIEIIFWFIFSYILRIIPLFIPEKKIRKFCTSWFILDSKLSTSKRVKIKYQIIDVFLSFFLSTFPILYLSLLMLMG